MRVNHRAEVESRDSIQWRMQLSGRGLLSTCKLLTQFLKLCKERSTVIFLKSKQMRAGDVIHLEVICLVYIEVLGLNLSVVGFGGGSGREQIWKGWQINEEKFDKELDIFLILKNNNIGKSWHLAPFSYDIKRTWHHLWVRNIINLSN